MKHMFSTFNYDWIPTSFIIFQEFQQIGRVMQYNGIPCSNANKSCIWKPDEYGCQCLNEYQTPEYIQQGYCTFLLRALLHKDGNKYRKKKNEMYLFTFLKLNLSYPQSFIYFS